MLQMLIELSWVCVKFAYNFNRFHVPTWSISSIYTYTHTIDIHMYMKLKSIVTLREVKHRHPMIAIVAIMRKSFVPMRNMNARALPRPAITNHMLGMMIIMMKMGMALTCCRRCNSTITLGRPMSRVVLIVYLAIAITPNFLSTTIRRGFRVCTRSVRQSMNCSW